jgi:hypothetical protein
MTIDFEALGGLLFATLLPPLLIVAGLLMALVVALAFVTIIRSAADE